MPNMPWKPIRTRHELTLWSCRVGHNSFVTVRRNNDGLRVTRNHLLRPVIPNTMKELHAAFDDACTATRAALILAYGPNMPPEDVKPSIGAIRAIENAISAYLRG